MYFPISDVVIPIWYLIGIGFAVGVCGGFWGVGGGWIVTPALYAFGLPMPLAVGTDLMHIVGKSIVSTLRHYRFGNVSVRVGLIMVPATIVGTEAGALLLEHLQWLGARTCDEIVTVAYVILVGSLAVFTFVESLQSKAALSAEDRKGPGTTSERTGKMEDRVKWDFSSWAQCLHIRPLMKCPVANVDCVSVWVIGGLGLVSGFLAGFLGVGGGFLRMPGLVYLVGLPTHVAVGTDLLEIMISGAYGGFTHALKGNVDVMIAMVMLLGASVGAQVGTLATRYVQGNDIRQLLGFAMTVAVVALVLQTYFGLQRVALIMVLTMAAALSLLIISYLIRGLMRPPTGKPRQDRSDAE